MKFLSSPKLPSACASDDIREIVDYVHSTYCQHGRQLFATGFSIGGNALAKMVGEDGDKCKLSGVYVSQAPLKFDQTV